MTKFNRKTLIDNFRAQIAKGIPIMGGGAGTGLSAKCEEAGGIDLIVIYNSGRYRMAGRGSLAGLLAYGNANEIVVDMAKEVLPVVKYTPLLAGDNGTDPFINMEHFIKQLKEIGFSGVQNFPTVGLFDGNIRANFEETGMGYYLEVDMIREAHSQDMLTTPYVFSSDNAIEMAKAGADIIVAHLGTTTGGSIGVSTAPSLEECASLINQWIEAASTVRDDIIFMCHGGPISTPDDVRVILDLCPKCHGFYGASSMERLPTEVAITECTKTFKNLKL